jgi:hypothetical protein
VPLKMPSTVQHKPTPLGVYYGLDKVSEPITTHVTKEKATKGVTHPSDIQESAILHPGVFTDGTKVTVEGGRTLNLGNYESARIGVTITVPCDKGSIEESYQWATDWVSKKIEDAVKEAKG